MTAFLMLTISVIMDCRSKRAARMSLFSVLSFSEEELSVLLIISRKSLVALSSQKAHSSGSRR